MLVDSGRGQGFSWVTFRVRMYRTRLRGVTTKTRRATATVRIQFKVVVGVFPGP